MATTYSTLRSKRTGGPLRVVTATETYADLDTASAAAERAHRVVWDEHFSPAPGYRTGQVVPPRASAYRTLAVAHPASATREDIIAAWEYASRYAVMVGAVILEARLQQAQERTA